MKELVVVSGKGGTGKTSLVAAFADLASDKVLADCDVDAPDLHLVLRPEIEHREDFYSGYLPRVQNESCLGCGVCEQACRFGAIELDRSPLPIAWITEYQCEGCGVCARVCPEGAISNEPRHCGELFLSTTKHGPLVHARLDVAAENSGKLVTRVRKEARQLAESQGRGLVIVDGPPGIGCPVIASIGGADLVLGVTEPSIAGQHDLERLVGVARHFDVPVAVCINKSDLAPEITRQLCNWCAGHGVPVVGEVPYDPTVTEAQIVGSSVIGLDRGPAAKAMADIWFETTLLLADAAARHEKTS